MTRTSAIPLTYMLFFGVYEPLMGILCFAGSLIDPVQFHNSQAPCQWPSTTTTTASTAAASSITNPPPPTTLPLATRITVTLLGHTSSLLGLVSFFVLWTARTQLSRRPLLLKYQEKVVKSVLWPLLFGDFFRLGCWVVVLREFGALREFGGWDGVVQGVATGKGMEGVVRAFEELNTKVNLVGMMMSVVTLVPRVLWFLGVGRYVHRRDGKGVVDKEE
ncbi:hypothetical protein CC1G_07867 [Coprinopsis cinerea okayama7|uniref:Uncharacterized protein n=1 Tax=Coprinopsis cinerea (strain Okayama-7 / 130 / ATCC MYA-4618 / FGSC 9003) TaxID=240176 RepID=A8P444_COPC7|nr:hypothetical protein CC1G_07867 [Coprinopsis cinerea okayama7\|eukprot:XP_001838676.2 hypothetical protein CC1G_07867 [Coprinopsis cinerea okayama7\